MNGRGAGFVLGIAIAVGTVFAAYPELDLVISEFFYNRDYKVFPHNFVPSLTYIRRISMVVVWTIAGCAVIGLLVGIVRPRTQGIISRRAAAFLLCTLLLGPLFVVNGILKPHWARSRPLEVTQFGGTEKFTPWWDWRGECRSNCSFVTGEGAAAFWTISLAALSPPPLKAVSYIAAIGFGIVVGLIRMSFGAHFATDVIFSGVLVFLIIWTVHGVFYRWRVISKRTP